jgi:2'-phosphotransferase
MFNSFVGIRSSAQVFIYIDVAKAMKANIKFYLSSNGVVLTEGNDYGVLEPVYFDKVEFVEIKADQLMGPVEKEQCATDTLSPH